jgi:acetoacetyl-CoA synthetase
LVTLTDDYAMTVHGRSAATLNRKGVRMSGWDGYPAVVTASDVSDGLVVGVARRDGGYWMPLFVSVAAGAVFDDRRQSAIRFAIGEDASSRHTPDDIIQIGAVPPTLTGKELGYPSNASCSVNVRLTSSISVPSSARASSARVPIWPQQAS